MGRGEHVADRIKGIVVEIGGDTTGLSKALSGVNKEISGTQKQLKDVERLLKADPSNIELLEQKQRLLGEAVEKTTGKLESLKTAEKQVQQQMREGKASQEQYDALKREIIATEQQLKSLETSANTAKAKLDGFATSAKNVEQKMKPVTAAVAGLAAAAVATVPATQELRADLSKLDQNARESSVGIDAAREAWRKLAVQSGETDSAVEATANLLQAGFTESNLQKAVEGLAGAAQRFPDTLKIESLADSLQETLATGKATGQFAELLDRLGVNAETFSEQLEKAGSSTQKQNLALQTLANAGLMESYQAWEKNNQALVDNQTATLEMQEQLAQFAETIQPLLTMVLQQATKLMAFFNGFPEPVQATIGVLVLLVGAIGPAAGAAAQLSTAFGKLAVGDIPFLNHALSGIPGILGTVQNGFSNAASFIVSNPIAAITAAIVALVALIAIEGDEIQTLLGQFDEWLQGVFAKDWTEVFGPVLGDVINTFFETLKAQWEGLYTALNGVIDFIRGVFTGDWERAWKGVQEIFTGIFRYLVESAKAPLNGLIGLLNRAIDAVNEMIDGFNRIGFDLPDWLGGGSWHPSVPHIPNIPKLARGTRSALPGYALVGERGPELVQMRGGERVFTANQTRSMLQAAPAAAGDTVSIGNITIYPTAAQWAQMLEMMEQWSSARQQRRAR